MHITETAWAVQVYLQHSATVSFKLWPGKATSEPEERMVQFPRPFKSLAFLFQLTRVSTSVFSGGGIYYCGHLYRRNLTETTNSFHNRNKNSFQMPKTFIHYLPGPDTNWCPRDKRLCIQLSVFRAIQSCTRTLHLKKRGQIGESDSTEAAWYPL